MENKGLCECNQGRLPCTCEACEPKAQYTAVDMATAAADGYRNGRESVVVELPSLQCVNINEYTAWEAVQVCKRAIIAAGGSVKE